MDSFKSAFIAFFCLNYVLVRVRKMEALTIQQVGAVASRLLKTPKTVCSTFPINVLLKFQYIV